MANITVTVQVACLKDELEENVVRSFESTKANEEFDGGVRDVGLVEEDITFTDITTPGILVIENIGANTFRYGPKSAGVMVPFAKVLANEVGTFRVDSAAVVLRGIALVGATKVRFWLFGE